MIGHQAVLGSDREGLLNVAAASAAGTGGSGASGGRRLRTWRSSSEGLHLLPIQMRSVWREMLGGGMMGAGECKWDRDGADSERCLAVLLMCGRPTGVVVAALGGAGLPTFCGRRYDC